MNALKFGFNVTTTPLDVLKKAVEEENIEGEDSEWGYYIKGILGEKKTNNAGWSYYVKFKDTNDIVLPMTAVDNFNGMTNLEGACIVDELVFYMTAYEGDKIYTKIPVITVENKDNAYTVKVVENNADKNVIEDVDVKVGEAIVGKTDENGEFKFVLDKSGEYTVKVTKDKDYPYIVRQAFVMENKEKDNVKEEDSVKPEIVTNIEENIVNKEELNFTAYANDNKDGKLKVVVKLNDSIVEGTDYNYKVKLSNGENKIEILAKDKEGNESLESITIIYKGIESNSELRTRVEKAIDESSNLLMKESKVDDWMALAIARSGKVVPENYINSIDLSKIEFATDYEKTIIGILAVGEDPCNFRGVNLVEKLYQFDLTKDTINSIAYGLIALDAGKYKVPNKAKWTREDLINKMLEYQNQDGGWSLFKGVSQPDITGMVMTALAPYNNNENKKVQEAISKAVKALQSMQVRQGKYKGAFEIKGDYPTPANSNSTAQVIVGLSLNGIDPVSEAFTKDGVNPVAALLEFKNENGGFGFINCDYNKIATNQSLYALEQYMYFLQGKGSIFAWGDKNPIKNQGIQIENLTDVKSFKCGDDAKVTMKVTNNTEKDQKVTLIISLYDKAGKFITYVAAEQTIDNGMESALTAMMKIPEKGEYDLKCFVWDDFENMNDLSESIIIPCKQS